MFHAKQPATSDQHRRKDAKGDGKDHGRVSPKKSQTQRSPKARDRDDSRQEVGITSVLIKQSDRKAVWESSICFSAKLPEAVTSRSAKRSHEAG